MLDQKLYETIEAYLNGDLKGIELSDFEFRLQSDKELADHVFIFKDIDSAIGDKSVLNFQKLVEEQGNAFLQEKDPKKTIVKKIDWRRYLIVAASAILLLAAVFTIKNQLNAPLSGKDLFVQHFESYDLNESLRGTDDAPDFFDMGIQKYQSGNFKEAATIFQNLSNVTPSDLIVTFCLANSYLNEKPSNFTKSRAEFEKIIQEGNSIYVPTSKWYLSLILLHQEERLAAEKLLKELENDGANWSIKARKLIDQLKK